jgi:hypothetical protein
VIEYRTTCRQFIDGHEPPGPVPPEGDGWKLAHVAAASGRIDGRGPTFFTGTVLCALIFYVWERERPSE